MAFKMKGPTFFKSPFKEIKKKKVKTLPVSQEGRDIDESNREESRGEVFSWNPGQQKRLTEKEARDRAAKIGFSNYPSYNTGKASNVAARKLHKVIEADARQFRSAMKRNKRGLDRST